MALKRPIVPDYSGGTAMDLHHLPFDPPHARRTRTENDSLVKVREVTREAEAYATWRAICNFRVEQICVKKCGTHRLPSVRPAKPFGVSLRSRSNEATDHSPKVSGHRHRAFPEADISQTSPIGCRLGNITDAPLMPVIVTWRIWQHY